MKSILTLWVNDILLVECVSMNFKKTDKLYPTLYVGALYPTIYTATFNESKLNYPTQIKKIHTENLFN